MQKDLRYRRSDFPPLPVWLDHLSLYLDFRGGKVYGTAILHMRARGDMAEITLNAKALDVVSVQWLPYDETRHHAPTAPGAGGDGDRLPWRVDPAAATLVVSLPRTLAAGEPFALRTETVCTPSANILEGIYEDTTPPGAPQQYMSQCEQWGFQRIVPILDDCTAKCTMTTTLEGDARYTHLISNGNISPLSNPAGRPVGKAGAPARQVITYENRIPMAPYLFIACAGTWDVLADDVVLPSGRRVALEYLVPPGRVDGARLPMAILKQSIVWQSQTQQYEYAYDVYRTICMEKSNFGGMENVGNTTIITSAALIDDYTDDARLVYAYAIIIHEYEHNQCGSDVTMETPFDMWLNEAFTVDVERQFSAGQFDPVCLRLDEVDAIRAPLEGPLAVEDGGHTGRIVRDGFNDPDELVDGVTYVKAAEVIRMLRLILGVAMFRSGKNLYFKRYNGGNANTDQFFGCFEEVSGRELGAFKREWLYTIGYPVVRADWSYEAAGRCLHIELKQRRTGSGGLFTLPVTLAAVNAAGQDIAGTVLTVELTGASKSLELAAVDPPSFVSFNRDASFYGVLEYARTDPEELRRQICLDPNGFNRVEAMRRLTDLERLALLETPARGVGEDWLRTWGQLLNDAGLPAELKAHLLRVDELSLERCTLPWYRERQAARQRLLAALATRWPAELVREYRAVDTYSRGTDPKDGMARRQLKAVLLRTLVAVDTPQAQALAEEHFHEAWHVSDRLSGLGCVHLTRHPRRRELLEEGYALWRGHLTAYTNYLRIIGSGLDEDVFDLLAAEERRDSFRIEHPGHSRALFFPMVGNNKLLWTARGLQWLQDTAVRLACVNDNMAYRLLGCCRLVHHLRDGLQPAVVEALRRTRAAVDPRKAPSTIGRIDAFLVFCVDGAMGGKP